MTSVDITQLEAILGQLEAVTEAAECHGTLTGLACGATRPDSRAWVVQALGEYDAGADGTQACLRQLEQLSSDTLQSLEDAGMAFAPLLPADDLPLQARTTALAEWCQGFLYGLSLAGAGESAAVDEDAGEAVRDLGEITRAMYEGDDDETGEEAYAELVEFVRVSVMVIFAALRETPEDRLSGPQA